MSKPPGADPSGPDPSNPSDPGLPGRRPLRSGGPRRRVPADPPRHRLGTAATDVQVHLAEDLVAIVLDIELNPAERTLMTAGRRRP